jgi:hypothetical protein
MRTLIPSDDGDSDLDDETNDPLEWKDLIANITATSLPGTIIQSQLNLALRLLKDTLVHLFKTPLISKLVQGSASWKARIDFSVAATEVAQGFKWCRITAQKAFRIMVKVLNCTTIDPTFTHTIKLLPVKQERNVILGKKYSKRPATDPARVMLEAWVLTLKENTNCKSDLSLRNIMNFILSACLPAFGLDVETWPANASEIVEAKFTEAIFIQLCQGKNNGKKACWLQVFMTNIVESNCVIDKIIRKRLAISCSAVGDDDKDDDGADHHRISTGDLDKMFLACKDQMPQKLMFMFMITTGVRIGGLTNIRIGRVAKLEANQWVANDTGRTICKGNKPYRFKFPPDVKDLIAMWLNNQRPADPTPFLFPGRDGGKISTASVRNHFNVICRKAGLEGAQFHPHALRHSFAHILLESGNTSAIVASLMNHASSATTEKFYLRESAEELTARANIPWLQGADKKRKLEPVIPSFLDDSKHVKENTKKKERRKKQKVTKLGSLAMFEPLPFR